MTKTDKVLEYRCGICEEVQWGLKTLLTNHKKTKKHKETKKALQVDLEKLSDEERIEQYRESDIKKIIKKRIDMSRPVAHTRQSSFKKYKRSNRIVYERSPEEMTEKKKDQEFKSMFELQLNKWHNDLRSCSVTGEDALDDILYCLFVCCLSPRVSTEGDFDLANADKSCYRDIKNQNTINDWISKLNIDYLINHTAELVTIKPMESSIYKCGELMSRHPLTKQLIKDKVFINCKNNVILCKLLKDCKNFIEKYDIFSKKDIVGMVWEYFNTKHGGNGGASKERGQYFTERPIMTMCCQLIEPSHIAEVGIDNNSTLGDEFCATFGFPLFARDFLKEKFNLHINGNNMYGVEYANRLSRLGRMNALFSGIFENIYTGDSFITNVTPHLDISFHNVPFGSSMKCKIIKETYEHAQAKENSNLPEFKDVIPIQRNGDAMLSSQVVVYKTRKMGILIIKDGEETSGVSNNKWREWFCNTCEIHKIMKIPSGAFSYTGTKTACIYFTKRKGKQTEKIQFLEMSETCDKIIEICEVTRSDLQQNNYSWDANVYLVNEEIEKLLASSVCEWKKLGEVIKFKPKSKHPSSYGNKSGKYPLFKSSMNVNSYVDIPDFQEECLIIGDGGSPNINYGTEFSATDHCYVFNSEKVNNKFIYYYIRNNLSLLKNYYKGSGLCNISKSALSDLDIPIPSQEIQTQTVQRLDDLASQHQCYVYVSEGVERRMKYYFDIMTKQYEREIKFEKLGDIIPITIGSTPSTKENKYWNNGTHIWVSVSELNNTTQPIINSVKKLTDVAIEECNLRLVKRGTTLMSFKLSIGKMGIAGCDLYTNEAIIQMDTKSELGNKWLYYYFLCYPPAGASGSIGEGSLNKDKLRNIEVINLPSPLKTQIVQYLDNLQAEKTRIADSLQLIDNEMRQILTHSYQ